MPFLLLFLPAAPALDALCAAARPAWRVPLLVALSLPFCGWWDLRFAAPISGSILMNWLLAEAHNQREAPERQGAARVGRHRTPMLGSSGSSK